MYKNIYIRKFTAVVLLAIFALSVTPTKYLHKLFANHVDFVSKTLTYSKACQLNMSGIDCHCNSNVVIAPYTKEDVFIIKPVPPVFTEFTFSNTCDFIHTQSISFGLRGPPTVA